MLALFLYSLLPVVANTVVGLGRCRRAAVDAARGMGMTDRQRLFGVELPLAFPVILTGIRIVLVQNIGLATIAALIGGGGFGTFVFQGIGQTAMDLVLLGAVPTVALAFAAAVLLDAAVDLSQAEGDRMIEIEDLTKRYDGTTVVDDVSLTVEPAARSRCMVGTSGFGQVDLAAHDQPPDRADRGPGADRRRGHHGVPEHELRRRIGYAIQGHGLFPHRTVAQNIATVPQLLGWPKARVDARVEELLELFQLDPAEFAAQVPARAVGRPAAARRRGAGAGRRARAAADGRAVRRAGRRSSAPRRRTTCWRSSAASAPRSFS